MAQNDTALPEGTDKVVAGASDETEVVDAEVPALRSEDEGGLADRFRRGRENLSTQAGEKARGLVSQGLERSAEALGNVAKLVGETAPGIEERLGPEYGDYARKAANAIESAADAIARKDPDELIDDTREFVRQSPGLALAGAAIVGFVIVRLVKTGLSRDEDDDDED